MTREERSRIVGHLPHMQWILALHAKRVAESYEAEIKELREARDKLARHTGCVCGYCTAAKRVTTQEEKES